MAKEKKEMFEKMEFNDAAYAKSIQEESLAKLGRVKIGVIIATIATVCSVLGIIVPEVFIKNNQSPVTHFLEIFILIAPILAIVSYIIGGGFLNAIKWAIKIGKLGYHLIPIIVVDLFIGFAAMVLALMAFLFAPIIFVGLNYIQIKRDYDDATTYLNFCEPAAE